MSRRLRSRSMLLFGALLIVASALTTATLTSASRAGANPALSHFQCYLAQSVPLPTGAPSFPATPPAVVLNRPAVQSTWLPSPGLVAGLPNPPGLFMHCNPTDKKVGTITTPMSNPNAHLDCWALAPNPTPLPTGAVTFTNQFGQGALVFKKALGLCLPSWKSLTFANLPSTTAPPGLDHFTCYAVVPGPVGTPSFTPPASAILHDQFFTHSTSIGTPNLLCSPVSKVIIPPTGTTVGDPTHYLVCFVIPPSTSYASQVVYAKNQFGTGTLAVINTRELCVPSSQP